MNSKLPLMQFWHKVINDEILRIKAAIKTLKQVKINYRVLRHKV